jgi:hypothetical protein
MYRAILAGILLLAAGAVQAADRCPALRQQLSSGDIATRIAAIACNENIQWYRPFIDTKGRVASTTVMEAESGRLADGAEEPWRRVAGYWRDSGLLGQMAGFPGASDCAWAMNNHDSSSACRAFVVDHPWSAAFVSWVMALSGVPGFRASASHFDFVRDARRHPDASPFLYLDPLLATPKPGDLLCNVRMPGRIYGYAGLVSAIDAGAGPLNMHCDIVVAVDPDSDGRAYLVGGNIQQGVTMRLLDINRTGRFWGLPQRSSVDPPCSPDNESSCNFNRQDWAVLLELKPSAALAALLPSEPTFSPQRAPPTSQCCVNCVVGADPPVPRCPDPGKP